MKALDLTGRRFGRLVALNYAGNLGAKRQWRCRCDCGNEAVITASVLTLGLSKSCGCFRVDFTTERNTSHGMAGTRIYRIWAGMLARCSNPKHPRWKWYGGRGISVCKRWEKFENFQADMGPLPSDGHSIEREDVNGNYEPRNCSWLPLKDQAKNRRLRTLKAVCPKGHPLPIIHGKPNARRCKVCRHERYALLGK